MRCNSCGSDLVNGKCPNCPSPGEVTGTLDADALTLELETIGKLESLAPGHAALRVLRGPQAGEVWTLDADRIEVGRSADCGLFLDDITVSRRHAEFTRSESGWMLTDLGSLNGSYVNRQSVDAPTELTDGDEIQIGKFRFIFLLGENS